MAILKQNDIVGNYTIQNIIKANLYTETYRAVDKCGIPFFLKLFKMKFLPGKLVNSSTNRVKEIEYCQKLNHKNLVSYIDSGSFENEEGHYQYYVTNYFTGAVLSDYIARNGAMEESVAISIFKDVLSGLAFLHGQTPSLCHNDLDPSNIMLSETAELSPVIIDLGHVSERCMGNVWFDTSDLDPIYHANETKMGIFDEQADIFSACAVLYYMLSGVAPWEVISSDGTYEEKFKDLWMLRKMQSLKLEFPVSDKVKYILTRGLKLKQDNRFASVQEVLAALEADEVPGKAASRVEQKHHHEEVCDPKNNATDNDDPNDPNKIDIEIKRGGGNGFKDVAGMQELKDYVTKYVIFPITDKEAVEKYRITPPNGMLLYGPPGCGKTFFAEKFAEETGFNFMLVKSSDVGSSLVHGTQEKVKKLFKKAEKNSPIVLCFDEFDALVPDRGSRGNEYVATEVNEYLAQMNNCAKRGIFIVATSNRPDKIDPAILRTGRIDKQVFVPLPDFEARKEMFKMYLNHRPVTEDVDFDALAHATEGYIASDIAFIVNDAAMTAAFAREPITYNLMCASVENIKPSLRKEAIEEYSVIKEKMNGVARRVVVESL